jgi:Putative porin
MAKNSLKLLVLLGGLTVGCVAPAFAQDSGPIIDKLVAKGLLTDQEGEDLRAEMQKDFGTSSAGKLNLSSALTELKISGDVRVRFEQRSGQNDKAVTGSPVGDESSRARFRDRLRLSLAGKLHDGWFFGTRLETGTGNRSTNNTMGDYSDSAFGKGANSTIQLGQAYIGRNWDDYTVTAGRFAAPQVTTSMLWDDDINPEGLAEQWKHESGNLTYIANLGQYVYDNRGTTSPFGNANATSKATGTDNFLLVEQVGAKYKFSNKSTLQVLPTYYSYTQNQARELDTGFGDLTGFAQSGSLSPVGLSVVDIPVEYAFTLFKLPAKIWVDAAMNLDASTRAKAAGKSTFDDQDKAYQVGVGIGQTKAKGDWEAKAFYQAVDAFALDTNLVDSDLFDSRTNMKGFGVSYSYVITDGVIAKLTYAAADRKDAKLVTYGKGDINPTFNALTGYQLIQADLSVKF